MPYVVATRLQTLIWGEKTDTHLYSENLAHWRNRSGIILHFVHVLHTDYLLCSASALAVGAVVRVAIIAFNTLL